MNKTYAFHIIEYAVYVYVCTRVAIDLAVTTYEDPNTRTARELSRIGFVSGNEGKRLIVLELRTAPDTNRRVRIRTRIRKDAVNSTSRREP